MQKPTLLLLCCCLIGHFVLAQAPSFSFHFGSSRQPAANVSQVVGSSGSGFELLSTSGVDCRFQMVYPISEKNSIIGTALFGFYDLQYSSTLPTFDSRFGYFDLPYRYQALGLGYRRNLYATKKHNLYVQAALNYMYYTPSDNGGGSFFGGFVSDDFIRFNTAINEERSRIFAPEIGVGYQLNFKKRAFIECNMLYSQSFQKIIKNGSYTYTEVDANFATTSISTGSIQKYHQNLVFSFGLGIRLF